MNRILREMVRTVAELPLIVKILIGAAILAEFIIITQWERITRSPAPPSLTSVVLPQKSEQQTPVKTQPVLPAKKVETVADEVAIAKHMARVVLLEPIVQSDGSITGSGRKFYLYGIKQFDSKKICTRGSGERWACGLHAYATLRNTVAKKALTCDPKTIVGSAVTATCRVGPLDVALMLVRDGLVEIDEIADDIELSKAQALARLRKTGVWDR